MTALAPEIIDVDPDDREPWLEARRAGIGSSDAAALFGMDRFSSPWSVYVSKIEALDDEELTEALEWGNRLEPLIADKFADEHPDLFVLKPPVMYRHAEHAFAQASPDRLLFSRGERADMPYAERIPTALLECKSSRLDEDWSDDVPPDRVVIQCQHQNLVMGTPLVHCAVLMHGRNYREFTVHRDDSVLELLVNVEAEFWQRVVDRKPPPADGHQATAGAIKQLYASVEAGAVVELGDEGDSLLRRRSELKASEKAIKSDLAHVENALRVMSGGAPVWRVRGEDAATWNSVAATKFDMDRLKVEHPELVAAYTVPNPHRRLNVAKGFK